ncbi:MAG: glycosyltransferase [Thiobacillus sp.]|nr:glycosyltransferase [Thiobacillus sp.]
MLHADSNLKTPPVISVLLSVYNSEKYVSLAIESILNQTFADFELIIVDDCSSDASWDICLKYAQQDNRIVAVRNKLNLGGCETLNVGLKLAKGRYIARQDNDDWSYPDRLAKQLKFMETHQNVGIVGGNMEIINEDGKVIGKRTYNYTDGMIRKKIFRYSPFSHPLVMFRKSILDTVGYYNPEYAPADDYDLYFRIGKVSKFANLNEILMKYRVIPTSLTNSRTKKMELATIKVRNLYQNDVHYRANILDKIYNILHFTSIYIVPSKIKIYIFNLFRNA